MVPNKEKRTLSLASWNVQGVGKQQRKLKDQNFLKLLQKYYILSLSETWSGPDSNVEISGFAAGPWHEK